MRVGCGGQLRVGDAQRGPDPVEELVGAGLAGSGHRASVTAPMVNGPAALRHQPHRARLHTNRTSLMTAVWPAMVSTGSGAVTTQA